MKDLPIHPDLKRQLAFLGFERCTPIQAIAIPTAVTPAEAAAAPGRPKRRRLAASRRRGPVIPPDMMLRAPTGSGKTLAFLIPVLHRILERGCKRDDGTLAIVLSPTKELALQTHKVAEDLTRMLPAVVCGAVAGGEKPKSEKARLRRGAAVLCATPGRLAYHLEHTATFSTGALLCLVLDEADRLLDLGFERQVRQICAQLATRTSADAAAAGAAAATAAAPAVAPELPAPGAAAAAAPPRLQTLLVSATLTPAVRRLAAFCLREGAAWADPEAAGGSGAGGGGEAEEDGSAFVLPKSLSQWSCVVPLKERLPALIAAVVSRVGAAGRGGPGKAIVFFSSCASVDFHHDLLVDAEWPSLRGNASRRAEGPVTRRLKGGFIGLAGDKHAGLEEDAEEEEEEEEGEAGEAEQDGDAGHQEGEAEAEGGSEGRQQGGARGTSEGPKKIFAGTPLFKLHGNLTKEERAGYIADFSRAAGGVLLASDAAARGLDFPRIDWIVQYDPPQRTEEYLHRVGRTARIGRAGNALLFLAPSEVRFLEHLRARGVSGVRPLEPGRLMAELLDAAGAPAELRRAKDLASLLGASLKSHVEAREPLLRMARNAFLSATRAYRAFPRELRSCFPYQELHHGHFAASFALRESPKGIARSEKVALGIEVKRGKRGRGRGRGARAADAPPGSAGWRGGGGRGRGGRGSARLKAGVGGVPGRAVDRRRMGGGAAEEFGA